MLNNIISLNSLYLFCFKEINDLKRGVLIDVTGFKV
jgi:hypothetical protein